MNFNSIVGLVIFAVLPAINSAQEVCADSVDAVCNVVSTRNLQTFGPSPFSTGTAIVGGNEHKITGSFNALVAGGKNEIEDGSQNAIIGGLQNTIVVNPVAPRLENAVIVGGQRNRAGHQSVAIGNFAEATNESSVVISARNAPGNAIVSGLTEGEIPDSLCTAMGENTVHICTKEDDGFYINEVSLANIVAEIATRLIEEQVQGACLTNSSDAPTSRRILSLDDCPKTFSPTHSPTNEPSKSPTFSPTLAFFGTEVGRILFNDPRIDWDNNDAEGLGGIDTKAEACRLTQSQLENIFKDAEKEIRFRELFPFCGNTGPTEAEVIGIALGVVAAGAAIFSIFQFWWYKRNEGVAVAVPAEVPLVKAI